MKYLTNFYPVFLLFIIACQSTPVENPADLIYYNGIIITMEGEENIVNAIAIKDGKIQALGTEKAMKKYQGEETVMIDLKEKTMLPGFIDPHSHFSMGMKMAASVDLSSPPVGQIGNIGDIVSALESVPEGARAAGTWITGWGYDPDQLEEKRHPNRRDLDEAFPNNPVFLLHVSGHMLVVNSKALELAGINKNTPNPENGVIIREEGTTIPNGVLQEAAMYAVLGLLPTPTEEQSMRLMEKTQDLYASQGITTAQDGFTDLPSYQFLRKAATAKKFKIDLEVLAGFRDLEGYFKKEDYKFGENYNRLRLAGIKLVGDGSPQGKTAYFSKPYLTEVPGCAHDCQGFPTIQPNQLEELITLCYNKDIQLYSHANGDGAIDLLLDAHEKVIDSLGLQDKELRTVVIHSQFVRQDQLERYKQFGFVPSYFSNHAFFWGDVHTENLGAERANFLSPMRTSTDMGITYTNHTDYIITPLNQLFTVWTAVNRTARSGKIIGEKERITPYEALKAITINAAYQHRTDEIKGSLKVDKLADLVILDKNPLVINPTEIKDIQVMETIKEGISIFVK